VYFKIDKHMTVTGMLPSGNRKKHTAKWIMKMANGESRWDHGPESVSISIVGNEVPISNKHPHAPILLFTLSYLVPGKFMIM
jgi:hypothetical protein